MRLIFGLAVLLLLVAGCATQTTSPSADLYQFDGFCVLTDDVGSSSIPIDIQQQYLRQESDMVLSPSTLKGFDLPDDLRGIMLNAPLQVRDNIGYTDSLDGSTCMDETAETVLDAHSGDCASMSKVLVAVLRSKGIPARAVTGCVAQNANCPIQALFTFGGRPKLDNHPRGNLHEWVEAYVAGCGWIPIEPTTGAIVNKCDAYIMYGVADSLQARCYVDSQEFVDNCQQWGG